MQVSWFGSRNLYTHFFWDLSYKSTITLSHLVVELEVEDEVVVARLTLLDGRVDVDDEVHLALVLVGQHEEPHDVGQRDLVVECLAVEVKERGEHLE